MYVSCEAFSPTLLICNSSVLVLVSVSHTRGRSSPAEGSGRRGAEDRSVRHREQTQITQSTEREISRLLMNTPVENSFTPANRADVEKSHIYTYFFIYNFTIGFYLLMHLLTWAIYSWLHLFVSKNTVVHSCYFTH